MTKLYIPVFSLTLILSASLLFSVQPMFSKMILPLLGGTPQVWNTAMLFFQVCLLAGYGYAHATTRFLNVKVQSVIHIILLFAVLFVLPFGIPEGWLPDETKDPTIWQLYLMTITIGAPFFVLAASAPMLQRWFTNTSHPDADNPYFLYGASNLGSMASLLAYPTIIEPMLNLSGQSNAWMYGFFALFTLVILSAIIIWNDTENKSDKTKKIKEHIPSVTNKQRLLWLFLSFVPSSLMLGVTTAITTDIASAPLLWIMPLALYVSTFIIAFARKPIISIPQARLMFDVLFISVISLVVLTNDTYMNPFFLIGIYLALFFSAATLCHLKLVHLKPHNKHLTEFYLFMSAGGALGGVFNAIIAPQLLILPIEFAIAVALVIVARFMTSPSKAVSLETIFLSVIRSFIAKKEDRKNNNFKVEQILIMALLILFIFNKVLPDATYFIAGLITLTLLFLRKTRITFAVVSLILLSIFPLRSNIYSGDNIIYQSRNFFGVIRIIDKENQRILMHGTTNHGMQIKTEGKLALEKISYYSKYSPIFDVMSYYDLHGEDNQKIAVLGLGIGIMSCFQKDGRSYDFYEIDPEIMHLAENKEYFTFLSDCGSPYKTILGDARIKIKEQPNKGYDLVLTDAFSSDNIPIHLLTKEAISSYLSKTSDEGAVVLHISNRYLDLEPILTKTASELGYELLGHAKYPPKSLNKEEHQYFPSHHVILTKSEKMKSFLRDRNWTNGMTNPKAKSWTDSYSNIIAAFGSKITTMRLKEDIKRHKAQP